MVWLPSFGASRFDPTAFTIDGASSYSPSPWAQNEQHPRGAADANKTSLQHIIVHMRFSSAIAHTSPLLHLRIHFSSGPRLRKHRHPALYTLELGAAKSLVVALLGLLEVDHVPDRVQVLRRCTGISIQERRGRERPDGGGALTSALTLRYWR